MSLDFSEWGDQCSANNQVITVPYGDKIRKSHTRSRCSFYNYYTWECDRHTAEVSEYACDVVWMYSKLTVGYLMISIEQSRNNDKLSNK